MARTKKISKSAKIAAALLLASVAAGNAALAESTLTPHAAEYKVKISVLSGKLSTRLETTEGGYSATHRIVPLGMARMFTKGTIEETSGFSTGPEGVLPATYESSDTLSRDKTQTRLSFDWSTGAVQGTVNDEPVEGMLEDLAHDRVSIQYELMYDLLNGGLSDTYILFDVDRLKTLNVKSIGQKEVKVPAGKYTALGIQHQAEGSSRVTTLWCVEELNYLPVIIEQHRKGKLKMRATLSRYTPETT